MACDDESWWGVHHGYEVHVDNAIGHLWVIHDGKITWDQLQAIKNEVWGFDDLWRLGPTEFAPDLLGNDPAQDSLATRYMSAWAEAREAE